jgi:hypothetical protein
MTPPRLPHSASVLGPWSTVFYSAVSACEWKIQRRLARRLSQRDAGFDRHGMKAAAALFLAAPALAEDQWVLTPDPLTAIQLRLD